MISVVIFRHVRDPDAERPRLTGFHYAVKDLAFLPEVLKDIDRYVAEREAKRDG